MPILSLKVGASADDAIETIGVTVITTGAIIDEVTEWLGVRWQNVTIPQGSKINSATVKMVPDSIGDEPNHPFWFEDVDNALLFVAGGTNISDRVPTTATVTWASANLGADGLSYFSLPDATAMVQEVVNRSGWVSGNAMVCFGHGSADTARDLNIVLWDANAALAATLDVDYTPPAGAPPAGARLYRAGRPAL